MSQALTALVIDDSEDDRVFYQRVLAKAFGERLRFIEAASGERGLEAIAAGDPDCVLLDYSLPGHNGIEVLKRIRARHPHLPVILLTGQGNEGLAVQSMKEGAQDYIAKSAITPETLGQAIRTSIEHSALKRRIDEQTIARDLFSRALAHDLKEPVRTVCWFTQMIADTMILQDDLGEYVDYIRKAGERMSVLIDTVLSYVELDGVGAPRHDTFALGEAVADAKANLFALLRERQTTISVASLPTVSANRLQVVQLLQNLLSNAASHCQPPVHVQIDAVEEDGRVRVFVKDGGPGIAPEDQQRIFEPFLRLNRSNMHCGLGLAICRKIVEMHRGKISCESDLGRGSCFAFSLPASIASADAAVPKDAIAAGSPASGRIANVLWVDDRPEDLLIGRAILTGPRGMKCQIIEAHDGKDGIATIRRREGSEDPVDLVLLDINMPVMSGFEMLAEMNQDRGLSAVPVVMCSGSSLDRDKERATALGAVGYVCKPATLDTLRPLIDRMTGIRLVPQTAGQPVLMVVGP